MNLVLANENITDVGRQAIKIQITVGNEGLKCINSSMLTDKGKKDPDRLYKLFEDQLDIHLNFCIHRMELMTFRQGQSEMIAVIGLKACE